MARRSRHASQTAKPLALDDGTMSLVTYDGSRWRAGVRVYVDGHAQASKVACSTTVESAFRTRTSRCASAPAAPRQRFQGGIADVRIYGDG